LTFSRKNILDKNEKKNTILIPVIITIIKRKGGKTDGHTENIVARENPLRNSLPAEPTIPLLISYMRI